jgi:diacylglycerol kinase family enzyme
VAIVNCSSGAPADRDPGERLREFLQARQLRWDVWLAHSSEELRALAREAAESDARVVVAGGGDGTINTVGACLAGGD